MTLRESTTNISLSHYFRICGYCDKSHGHYHEQKYHELPKDFQDGIVVLIHRLYELQKMVYLYDIEFVSHYMKRNGIKLRPFFSDCDLPHTFFRTLSLQKNRELRLMAIRIELIRTLNRLFNYVLKY